MLTINHFGKIPPVRISRRPIFIKFPKKYIRLFYFTLLRNYLLFPDLCSDIASTGSLVSIIFSSGVFSVTSGVFSLVTEF